MKKIYFALAAASLVTTMSAVAFAAATDFVAVDQDNDEKLTLQEAQTAYPTLKLTDYTNADINQDGSLDVTEFAALSGFSTEAVAVDAMAPAEVLVKTFVDVDQDSDDKLTLQEAQTAYPALTLALYGKADGNQDMSLDESEFGTLMGMSMEPLATDATAVVAPMPVDFATADQDSDDKLTLPEAQTAYPDLTLTAYTAADSNQDGVLDETEFAALAKV